ncbi:MAG: MFS transporter, partial [Opitutales bacterium]|nr:MFS transporter [Opitutales bacterium]
TIYWMYGSFLSSLKVENITGTLSVGQISELVFMSLLPLALPKLGFKKTLALGTIAMLARYAMSAFAPDMHALYWGAIAMHGLIFGFFFVAAQMYVDKKASADIRAQAQGLFFFFYGVAQIIGTFFSTWLIEHFTSKVSDKLPAAVNAAVATTDWQSVFLVETAICAALLVFFALFFKDDVKNA